MNVELKSVWYPKNSKWTPLPWKVTKIFAADDGEEIYRLEKYQGGRNSPALITKNKLKENFSPNR